jgi:hypothetical protein
LATVVAIDGASQQGSPEVDFQFKGVRQEFIEPVGRLGSGAARRRFLWQLPKKIGLRRNLRW